MKQLWCIFLLLFASTGFAQERTFNITDFSQNYYGKVHFEDLATSGTPGWVAIYRSGTDKELLRTQTSALELHVQALNEAGNFPYNDQNYLIYKDFNFDGIKDLALNNGPNGIYGGSTYDIYLGTESGFVFNKPLTQLVREKGILFEVQPKEKELVFTLRYSVQIYGQFIYKWEKGKPVLIKTIEKSAYNDE